MRRLPIKASARKVAKLARQRLGTIGHRLAWSFDADGGDRAAMGGDLRCRREGGDLGGEMGEA
jgi:hypothetical protein